MERKDLIDDVRTQIITIVLLIAMLYTSITTGNGGMLMNTLIIIMLAVFAVVTMQDIHALRSL